MKRVAMMAAASMAFTATHVGAADEWATGADLRCVVAFSALIANPAYHDGATTGLFYYLGRLDARDPNFDLAKGLREVKSAMQSSQYATEAQRCGAELKARNEFLKTLSPPATVQRRGVG